MSVDTKPIQDALTAAMDDLVDRIREEANDRGKVASGRTLASLRTTVLVGDAFATGTLTGNDNWKYWGNGRGPGRMPPVGPLDEWARRRGLNLSGWAIAKRIARDGSRDHRLGRTNIVQDSITAWQEGAPFKAVGPLGIAAFGGAFVQEVATQLKKAA